MINKIYMKGKYHQGELDVVYTKYADGNRCIRFMDGATPMYTATVNIPELIQEIKDTIEGIRYYDSILTAAWHTRWVNRNGTDFGKVINSIVIIKDCSENVGVYTSMEEAGMILHKWADANVNQFGTQVQIVELTPLAMEGWE